MKKFGLAACLALLVLCIGGVAHAAIYAPSPSATVTYTVDNEVLAWWLTGPSGTSLLPLGTNASEWRTPDSYELSGLVAGGSYEIIWEVKNLWSQEYPPGGNNPGGFLAQIAFGGQAPILSSGASGVWQFAPYLFSGAPFGSLSWSPATAYGANSGGTIWSTVNGGTIAGIDGNAQWIWGPNNIWVPHGFVRATFTAPVPLPAAAWMLGAGLVGLVAIRRRRQERYGR